MDTSEKTTGPASFCDQQSCAASGDDPNSYCVYGDHCACSSTDFECDTGYMPGSLFECKPGGKCIAIEKTSSTVFVSSTEEPAVVTEGPKENPANDQVDLVTDNGDNNAAYSTTGRLVAAIASLVGVLAVLV